MSQVWERLFVLAARCLAWTVAAVPILVALLLVAAMLAGRRAPPGTELAQVLFLQLSVTLVIALVATVVGATLGIGCAVFSHELARPGLGRIVRLQAKSLAAVPGVVFGWFGVVVLLSHVAALTPIVVLAVATAVLALATLPDAYILAVRSVRALPVALREAAAALGANTAQTASQVVLPGSLRRFAGIYATVFSRALVESAAVSIVFLYAARAGYSVSHFSLGAALLAQPTATRAIDAGMAVAAMLVFALSILARVAGVRRIGELEWV